MDNELNSGKINKRESWAWLSNGDLKKGTEALICAAQEQTLRTNYLKFHIDKTIKLPLCRLRRKIGESISHTVCGCSAIAQLEHKRRHVQCWPNCTLAVMWKIELRTGWQVCYVK